MVRQLAALPPAQAQRLRMSYQEWRIWEGEGRHGEWVDGEVIVFVPPSEPHLDRLMFLATLLRWYTRVHDLGKVIIAPFEMRLASAAREPDILFVAKARLGRLSAERLDGPADLVVEFVSRWSAARDLGEKRAEYASAGVREYWVFDARPGRRRARFMVLEDEVAYSELVADTDGRYRSTVLPGFWLDVAWLWQDRLPDPDELIPLILAGR